MTIWNCDLHGLTASTACCGNASRHKMAVGLSPAAPLVLECFDRFVAEMRARIEAEPCSLAWGEHVDGGMSVKIGKVTIPFPQSPGTRYEDGEGPE